MNRSRIGLAGALGFALVACAPRPIPGTQIPDTEVNRILMGEMEVYRQAVERRDTATIMALVSPNYFDVRGHPDDPNYHWNYERVKTDLPEKFAKTKDIRLEFQIRKIEVKGNYAQVSYMFTENFVAQLPSGSYPKHDSDVSRMEFQLVDKHWLIMRGL